MRNIIVLLLTWLSFQTYSQIENRNGVLVFGDRNAYFIEIDSLCTKVSPEYLSHKIENDTALILSGIPSSLIDEIVEKTYYLQVFCRSDVPQNVFIFPCHIEHIEYMESLIIDSNCFCFGTNTFCGVSNGLRNIEHIKLNYLNHEFDSKFLKNAELSKERFSSFHPGLFSR